MTLENRSPKSHCDENRLWLYFDGRVTGTDRHRMETHLQDCDQCRARLEDMERLGTSLAAGCGDRDALIQNCRSAVSDYLTRLERRSRWVRFAAAAAIVLAATVAGTVFLGRPDRKEAPGVSQPGVAVHQPTVDERPLKNKPAESLADDRIAFACGAVARLDGNAALRLRQNDAQGVSAHMDRGRATFKVIPGTPVFRIETADAVVRVTGTEFTVQIDEAFMDHGGGPFTAVSVASGSVSVTWWCDGEKREDAVKPGDAFTTRPAHLTEPRPLPPVKPVAPGNAPPPVKENPLPSAKPSPKPNVKVDLPSKF